jgi:hypothetical protein
MPYTTKTSAYRHELAGRILLGRDDMTYSALASHYGCCHDHVAKLSAKLKDASDDFLLLAINAAERYYDQHGIEVSAGSIQAYLQRRKLSGYDTVQSAVNAHEEKVRGILDRFQGAPIQFIEAKNVIACTIRKLALNPIDAHTVNAALEDMGNALDQLEPSSSTDQRGVAPREFYKQISPCLKIVNSRLLIQYTFICGETGR